MKISVPYYSQFVDIQDPYWMLRACGGLCAKMVAEYHGVHVPDILDMCNEARERGGYHLENGWVHDYLVVKLNEWGLSAHREEALVDTKKITEYIQAGNPVIVSVEKRVLEQARFHMVTLVGVEEGEEVGDAYGVAHPSERVFIYHETESTNKEKGQYRRVGEKQFLEYFRGKAIFVKKK